MIEAINSREHFEMKKLPLAEIFSSQKTPVLHRPDAKFPYDRNEKEYVMTKFIQLVL